MPPRTKERSKKELLAEQITAAVGAGREVAVETVDFSDPNRPKTCLEVDFPIIPINQIADIEGNAGKPIYQMSKWWARRRSSVFRSMLLAATMRAPEDESKAAKAVWDVYYANHQKCGTLRHLKVAEPFMGGGTTIVEGSRLGMQMFGCDLNPVAWFVVKNEMAQVDIAEVKRLLADIEAEVKPLIMPYYACDGPDGEKGKWFHLIGTKERTKQLIQPYLGETNQQRAETEDRWEELPSSFDIFSVPWQERKSYRYEGPEIIYTFWTKHGPCQRAGCGHRTPILSSPVVAIKTLTLDAWKRECSICNKSFDVERHAARMSPDSPLFIASSEEPFAVMDNQGRYKCPHCGNSRQDTKAFVERNSPELGKAKSKKVELTLLIHPQWIEGCTKHDEQGQEYGGSATDPVEATIRWNNTRTSNLRLLEIRGALPEKVTCPETKVTFYTDRRGGTITKSGHFKCHAPTCGSEQSNSDSISKTSKTAPIANFVFQGHSPQRHAMKLPYGGRFFLKPNANAVNAAITEWESRKVGDLSEFWPQSEIPFGHMTHQRQPLPDHGFTHWWNMFHPRQLLINSQLLKAISSAKASESAKLFVLGFYQNFLRNENLFCFWHASHDHFAPHLSNNNYHPKSTVVEVGPFCPVGYGPWPSATGGLDEALNWRDNPWEIYPIIRNEELASGISGKGLRIPTHDPVQNSCDLVCKSATELSELKNESIDVVITDPPFGGLLHYSELSDFFYVWLRLALKSRVNRCKIPLETGHLVLVSPEDAHCFSTGLTQTLCFINVAVSALWWKAFHQVAGIPTEWWKQGSPRGHRQLIVRHHAELSVILQALGSKAQGQALPLASTWKRLAEIFQTSGSNIHETLLPEWLKTWHHELSTVGPERLEEPIQIWQKRSGRSPEHLARSCRRHYGMTPSTLLNMARIEWVKQRLITSEEKVISLAIECGFNNMSHFHRLFTKHVGLTPSRWRHSHISTVPL